MKGTANRKSVTVSPSDVEGYAVLLKFWREDGAGFQRQYLTVEQHRNMAEALAAMLGVALAVTGHAPGDWIVCDRCGQYRQRKDLLDVSTHAERPGVSAVDIRYFCIIGKKGPCRPPVRRRRKSPGGAAA